MEHHRFIRLSESMAVEDAIRAYTSIILCKPPQSGKTSDVFRIVEKTWANSITVFVSDKNVALAGQTNVRARSCGFTVINFNEADVNERNKLRQEMVKSKGKKKIFHFLMELNNLNILTSIIWGCREPVTLIIDEADKNKNVIDFNAKEEEDTGEDTIPIITRKLLSLKNELKSRNNGSKVVFVTATPQSLLVAEKEDDRVLIYKDPYNNYVGCGLDKCAADNITIMRSTDLSGKMIYPIPGAPSCRAMERWTNKGDDLYGNTYKKAVRQAVEHFKDLSSKDESVKQVMLISLESRNAPQERMAQWIDDFCLDEEGKAEVDVVCFNGSNKLISGLMLSEVMKMSRKKKIIIIAGFMASRGVSFTDFSDPKNKFELVIQVHETDRKDPLNSSAQAMRIFGPARKTVTKPFFYGNKIAAEDLMSNFTAVYTLIQQMAEGATVISYEDASKLKYDAGRPLAQPYNFRWLRQNEGAFLRMSANPLDAEPIDV